MTVTITSTSTEYSSLEFSKTDAELNKNCFDSSVPVYVNLLDVFEWLVANNSYIRFQDETARA